MSGDADCESDKLLDVDRQRGEHEVSWAGLMKMYQSYHMTNVFRPCPTLNQTWEFCAFCN